MRPIRTRSSSSKLAVWTVIDSTIVLTDRKRSGGRGVDAERVDEGGEQQVAHHERLLPRAETCVECLFQIWSRSVPTRQN